MAQKLLTPFKKLPTQIQNLQLFRKAQNAFTKQTKGALFTYQQSCQFAFPENASTVAYDEELDLLLVGTRNGVIRLYGAPSVTFLVGNLEEEIFHLAFLPKTGKIVSLSGKVHANRIGLWSFQDGKWKLDKSTVCDDVHISAFAVVPVWVGEEKEKKVDRYHLWLGTETPDVRVFNLKEFEFLSNDNEAVWPKSHFEKLLKGGEQLCDCSIVSMELEPVKKESILIAFKHGLVVVHDLASTDQNVTLESKWTVLLESKVTFDNAETPTAAGGVADTETPATALATTEEETISLLSASWVQESVQEGQQDLPSTASGSVICGFADGHYTVLSLKDSKESTEVNTPYGPFPCTGLHNVMAFTSSASNETLLLFSGGMPRSTYSDRHTVSIQKLDSQRHVDKSVCFDVHSAVLQLCPLYAAVRPTEEEPCQRGALQAVLLLCEEELIVIDLHTDDWLEYSLPYLNSLNFSPITAMSWMDNMTENMYFGLAGKHFGRYTNQEWPVRGGKVSNNIGGGGCDVNIGPVLITGHVNGVMAFWSLKSGGRITPIGSVSTAPLYNDNVCATKEELSNEDNLWPPFRRVGLRRDYGSTTLPLDEYRLAISQIDVIHSSQSCGSVGHVEGVLLATLGGHCTLWKWTGSSMVTADGAPALQHLVADVLTEEQKSNYVWQDKPALEVKSQAVVSECGFQMSAVVAVHPPAPILCMQYHNENELVALGTAHGVALVDLANHKVIFHKTLLPVDPAQLAALTQVTQHGALLPSSAALKNVVVNRSKRLRENFRHSMRRIRKIRIPRSASYSPTAATTTNVTANSTTVNEEAVPTTSTTVATHQEEGGAAVDKGEETTEYGTATEGTQEASLAEDVHECEKTDDGEDTIKDDVEELKDEVIDNPEESSTNAEEVTVEKKKVTHADTNEEEIEVVEEVKKQFPLTGADLTLVSSRSIHLAKTYLHANAHGSNAAGAVGAPKLSLFVGTQQGSVLMFTVEQQEVAVTSPIKVEVTQEGEEKPTSDEQATAAAAPAVSVESAADSSNNAAAAAEQKEDVGTGWKVTLTKELKMRHNAPVIGVAVLKAKSHTLLLEEDLHKTTAEGTVEPTEHEASGTAAESASAEKENTAEQEKPAASKPSAAAVPSTAHELLVCTEEQVKVFSLPQLWAKHKHRVTSLFSGHSTNASECGQANDSSTFNSSLPRSPTGTLHCNNTMSGAGTTCTLSSPAQLSGRRIRTYALQWDSQKTQRLLLLLLNNGQFQVLNLHTGLRKLLTGQYSNRQNQLALNTSVGAYSSNYRVLISQPNVGELAFTEYSLEGDAGYHPSKQLSPQSCGLNLPVEQVEAAPAVVEDAGVTKENKPPEGDAEAAAPAAADTVEPKNATDLATAPVDEHTTNGEHHNGTDPLCDITMDSIREYLSDKNDLTTHTVEKSIEKKIVMCDGQMTTTIHEKTIVDGEVKKDETHVKTLPAANAEAKDSNTTPTAIHAAAGIETN